MKKLILLTMFLAGCAMTPEQQAKYMISKFGPQCEALGFPPDSPEYRNCILNLYNTEIGKRNAAINAYGIIRQ